MTSAYDSAPGDTAGFGERPDARDTDPPAFSSPAPPAGATNPETNPQARSDLVPLLGLVVATITIIFSLVMYIDTKIDNINTRIDGINTRIDGIDTRIDDINTRIDDINTRIDSLGDKIDRGNQEMRSLILSAIRDSNRRTDNANNRIDNTNSRIDQTYQAPPLQP